MGTKQNTAKEAQIVNRIESPDFGWLNVDRYVISTSHTKVLFNEFILTHGMRYFHVYF